MPSFPSTRLTRRSLVLAALTLGVAGIASAESVVGSGQRASQSRSVGAFEAIDLAGPIKLVVRQSGRVAVEVEADDNVLPLVETDVIDRGDRSTLRVRLRPGESVRRAGAIVVSVEVDRLLAVSSAGSGDVEIGALRSPTFRLSLAGSTDAGVRQLQTDRFEASIAGSGDLRVDGQAQEVKLSIAGSGDADLGGLRAARAKVSIAGSGDADVVADEELSVSIAGSGDVRYAGDATKVRSSVVGSGSVRRR